MRTALDPDSSSGGGGVVVRDWPSIIAGVRQMVVGSWIGEMFVCSYVRQAIVSFVVMWRQLATLRAVSEGRGHEVTKHAPARQDCVVLIVGHCRCPRAAGERRESGSSAHGE